MSFRLIKWLIGSCFAVILAVPAFADSDFLKPSEAFQLQLDTVKREVQWTISDGYYLYESRVKVVLANDKTVSIPFHFLTKSDVKDDPNFGIVQVFHNRMVIVIDPVGENMDELKVTYQAVPLQVCVIHRKPKLCHLIMLQRLTKKLQQCQLHSRRTHFLLSQKHHPKQKKGSS